MSYGYRGGRRGRRSSQGSRGGYGHVFQWDDEGYAQVWTDGACLSNGQWGARAGFGVFWGDNHELNVSSPVSGRPTNNNGEIEAATTAMRQAIHHGIDKLAINTDSMFLINAVTRWMPRWKQNGWRTAVGERVRNEREFRALDQAQRQLDIKFNFVEAHRGDHGNEMADRLAKDGAACYQN